MALSIGLAVVATEPVVRSSLGDLLVKLDIAIAIIFLIEYILRLWVAPLRDGARRGIRGALEYAITPLAILDLIAIAPTILGLITPELLPLDRAGGLAGDVEHHPIHPLHLIHDPI